jgi:hypothetical protein
MLALKAVPVAILSIDNDATRDGFWCTPTPCSYPNRPSTGVLSGACVHQTAQIRQQQEEEEAEASQAAFTENPVSCVWY